MPIGPSSLPCLPTNSHAKKSKVILSMLKPAAELKAKLATDEPVIGMMATDQAWPLLVEICQNSGLDYLIIDREHGNFSDELVSQICQVGRLANFPVMMRTVSCETSIIRRAMDLGPCGLLLPCVELPMMTSVMAPGKAWQKSMLLKLATPDWLWTPSVRLACTRQVPGVQKISIVIVIPCGASQLFIAAIH